MSKFEDKTRWIETKSRDECAELLDALADGGQRRSYATADGTFVLVDDRDLELLEAGGYADAAARATLHTLKRRTN